MTYTMLADMTRVAKRTLHHIGSRDDYNVTLATIERLCRALRVTPGELLELIEDRRRRGDLRNTERPARDIAQ